MARWSFASHVRNGQIGTSAAADSCVDAAAVAPCCCMVNERMLPDAARAVFHRVCIFIILFPFRRGCFFKFVFCCCCPHSCPFCCPLILSPLPAAAPASSASAAPAALLLPLSLLLLMLPLPYPCCPCCCPCCCPRCPRFSSCR